MNVLHVMSSVETGGISMVVLNYIKNLQNKHINFDIAITSDTIGQTGKQFEIIGVNIYKGIPQKSVNLSEYKKRLREILMNKRYDAIHVHENETSYVALSVAKKMGVKIRIAHSHTSSPYVNYRSELRRLTGLILNKYYATSLVSCSKESAHRVFGNSSKALSKLTILPNAIETSKFSYNLKIRQEYRDKFGLEEKFVIATVGRIDIEKNHEFLLDLYIELIKICENSILVIIGDGPLKDKLNSIVKKEKLENNVLLLGTRDDVSSLMQAFDVFVLPSFHEGFPIVIIEAAVAGLPIILSSNITDEVKIGEDINFVSLDETKTKWINLILKYKGDMQREIRSKSLNYDWIDIGKAVRMFERLYF